MKNAPIKIGDLVYAVGPGHNAPHSADDLQVYSTPVTAVRLDGSYSDSCPPEILTKTRHVSELGDDRPYLGFSKWIYYDFEVGRSIHRSRAEALQAYEQHATQRRDRAERERDAADKQVKWALAQAAANATAEDGPLCNATAKDAPLCNATAEDGPLCNADRPTVAAPNADTENAP